MLFPGQRSTSVVYKNSANLEMWMSFRRGYSVVALLSCVILFAVAGMVFNTIQAYLLFGACLSTLFTVLVMASYRNVPQWRRHPSPIIIQRTVTNFLFSIIIILNSITKGSEWNYVDDDGYVSSYSCRLTSYALQFFVIAGESWMFMISIDLVLSLTNPFISYHSYLSRYHVFVWTLTICNIVAFSSSNCNGVFIEGICWITYEDHLTTCFVTFFLGWSMVFYAFSLLVVGYALFRLSVGLEATFHTRRRSVQSAFGVVTIYSIYGSILCCIYATLRHIDGSSNEEATTSGHIRSARTAEAFLAYLVGCRGFVDSMVWCLLIDYCQPDKTVHIVDQFQAPPAKIDTLSSLYYRENYRKLSMCHYSLYYYYALVVYDSIISCCVLLTNSRTGGNSQRLEEHAIRGDAMNDCAYQEPLLHGTVASGDVYSESPIDVEQHAGTSNRFSKRHTPRGDVGSNISNGVIRTHGKHSNMVERISELDMTPQLNMALRREVLHCATDGIKKSIIMKSKLPDPADFFNEDDEDFDEDGGNQGYYSVGGQEAAAAVTRELAEARQEQSNCDSLSTTSSYSCNDFTSASATSAAFAAVSNAFDDPNRVTSTKKLQYENDHSRHMNKSTDPPDAAKKRRNRKEGLRSRSRLISSAAWMSGGLHGSSVMSATSLGSILFGNSGHGGKRKANPIGSYVYYNSDIGSDASLDSSMQNRDRVSASESLHESIINTLRSVYYAPSSSSTVPYIHSNPGDVCLPDARNTPLQRSRKLKLDSWVSASGQKAPKFLFDGFVQTPCSEDNQGDSHELCGDSTPQNPSKQSKTNANNDTGRESASSTGPSTHEQHLHALLSAYLVDEEPVEFLVDDQHPFIDHRPSTFQILRNICGISNDVYLRYISVPGREKLTEGSSGAFMFNCGVHDELLVKTVSTEEKDTLLRILHEYTFHLHGCGTSLLVRFLGLHTLTMYGHDFHFVVMKNIFPPEVANLINERYDIKGSWVDRNATIFPPGQYTTCRYCNEYYISGTNEKCYEKVGFHEPNIVFRDNNLTNKFRLNGEDAYMVIETLHKDSDALCAMGIMDYSMLVGIRNIEYEVDLSSVLTNAGSSMSHSQPQTYECSNSAKTNGVDGRHAESSAHNKDSCGLTNSLRGSDETRGSTGLYMHYGGIQNSESVSCGNASYQRNSGCVIEGHLPFVGADFNTAMSNGSEADKKNKATMIGESGYPARSVVAPGIYYFGIIDILQSWTVAKKIERLVKVNILKHDPHGISCMEPKEYKERFQKRVSEVVEHGIYVREITGSWKGNRAKTEPAPLIPNNRNSTSGTRMSVATVGSGSGRDSTGVYANRS